MKLVEKTAIVTGSSRGIGAAIAKALAKEGANVVVTYKRNQSKAEEITRQIISSGGAAVSTQLHIEDRKSVKQLIADTLKELGRLDILVNNAAISQEKTFREITDQDWEKMFEVNMKGTFICCQETLPLMEEQRYGKVVNITSIGGQWGGWNQVHYAATKAGIISLTRSLARIYSQHNITVNAISPGLVLTDMSKKEINSEAGKKKLETIPMKRFAFLEEIASATVFLASDDSSYITGQTINVNGGMPFH